MSAVQEVDTSPEQLAHEVFEIVKQVSLLSAWGMRRPDRIKEGEFLTLAMLHQHRTLTVGELQRVLGVLPAQMSRLLRGLESRQPPFVSCRANPKDKRRVDVRLTTAGVQVLGEYRRHRIERLVEVLNGLSDAHREGLAAAIGQIGAIVRDHSEPRL